ncbi:hypothetical protein VST7929_00276 [Vibrio stylophorae]|uniref:DUF3265 domain-containing protein n=1 Tax=Vibrio stylophorae TaxID=659351 RepID=A0ABN8DR24_9VIBR|nr:hypothetical protein VST7929_00276 [Vibrio stylophorae]
MAYDMASNEPCHANHEAKKKTLNERLFVVFVKRLGFLWLTVHGFDLFHITLADHFTT